MKRGGCWVRRAIGRSAIRYASKSFNRGSRYEATAMCESPQRRTSVVWLGGTGNTKKKVDSYVRMVKGQEAMRSFKAMLTFIYGRRSFNICTCDSGNGAWDDK
jgi:hypothetical protein